MTLKKKEKNDKTQNITAFLPSNKKCPLKTEQRMVKLPQTGLNAG